MTSSLFYTAKTKVNRYQTHMRREGLTLALTATIKVLFTCGDRITSRNRFGKVQPKGAVAGDSRPVPADRGMVGKEHPAVFP